MDKKSVEALYLTITEVMELLGVSRPRVYQLRDAGEIEQIKGSVFLTASVEAYKLKRGDKKGGRYPAHSE